jgi:dihydrofolate reductase
VHPRLEVRRGFVRSQPSAEDVVMATIALSQNVTLDGVMQSPGPTDVPFEHRGWAVDFAQDEGFDFEAEVGLPEARRCSALLLGRITYEAMVAAWPHMEGELADTLNTLPKYVVSSTLEEPTWNATVLGGDWADEVARLQAGVDGDIVVYGSRRLAGALLDRHLVDEVRQIVYPLVLGTGDRLFGETRSKVSMRLLTARTLSAGVLHLVHQPLTPTAA